MATAGALVGASIAGLAYKLSGQNYILTFALATIPATLALVITCTVGALQAASMPFAGAYDSYPAYVVSGAVCCVALAWYCS